MAICKANKIDSNVTGLRFAEEECIDLLPADPVWYALEPNSYSDFGGQLTTQARNPINPSRQRKKGVVTDLEASGGFNQDLTFSNTTRLLQGFFYASIREKGTTAPMNSEQRRITAVGANEVTFANPVANYGFLHGNLVLAEGFGNVANNGLKQITAAPAGSALTVSGMVAEASPPATAKLTTVGFRLAAGTCNVTMNGGLVRLEGMNNPASIGLIAGEWIFVGGDQTANRLNDNYGFARIKSLGNNFIELDKVSWEAKAESSAGKSVDIFFGQILKNEKEFARFVRRSYSLERVLGSDDNGQMSEYLHGSLPNEMTINIAQADKVNIDLSFVSSRHEPRTGEEGPRAGQRVDTVTESAYNTSSDFTRIKLARVSDSDAAPKALFAFATELSLSINNNVSQAKAVGVLGAIDATVGTLEVGGSMTAYFADIDAVKAVRNNETVTLDIIMQKDNRALIWDIPEMTLGGGRINIEQDQAITLPLDIQGFESSFGHTIQLNIFPYLPDLAQQ